jgi:hypothetical protein
MSDDLFFDPYDTANERAINVESWTTLDFDASGDVVRIVGRADPVVVTAVRPYPGGSLKLITLDEAERNWLGSLLSTGRVIGFKPGDPSYGLGTLLYLYVGKASCERVGPRARQQERRWTLDVQVTEAPVVTL